MGSSPLARGTRPRTDNRTPRSGLIPARAGNTCSCTRGRNGFWAHPRSRGEHMRSLMPLSSSSGSSPLARGTPRNGYPEDRRCGLIPARAGNTTHKELELDPAKAHPRSRGEHSTCFSASPSNSGSSPLARGTRSEPSVSRTGTGLIPARAGNTHLRCSASHICWAHPRSRGEHLRKYQRLSNGPGSSPLARGTHWNKGYTWFTDGLIPARAGNTPSRTSEPMPSGAHPRSRGEHYALDRVKRLQSGSSPLARGTRLDPIVTAFTNGLIPARAGNTVLVGFTVSNDGAHPRSRGEHTC